MTAYRTVPGCLLAAAALLIGAGCNNPSSNTNEETSVVGRNATIEFKPVMTGGDTSVHKQRSGRLVKVNSQWVVMDEGGAEIWVPKEMVLEIRMGG